MMKIIKEKISGETIPRISDHKYLLAVQDRSTPPNLSRVEDLRNLLHAHTDNVLIATADQHLIDAGNEQLPQKVREEHFDLAGAWVWEAHNNATAPVFEQFFSIWQEAGGILC